MTKIVNIPQRDHSDIEAEARAWLVQLDGTRPGKSELREFREWMERSPFHREAFTRALSVWNDLDGLALRLDPACSRPDGNASVPMKMLPTGAMIAAGAFLLVFLIVWLAFPLWQLESTYSAAYATSIGETQAVTLPDGTRVQLNTGTHIAVALDHKARLVRLDAGEAWFRVAHDRKAPFVVYARQFAVRAVGTAFSVRVDGDSVGLTVTDGHVEVASMKKPLSQVAELQLEPVDEAVSRVPLEKGQHVVFNEGIESVRRMAPSEIERILSWRDGMLIFDNDPLEDVVTELNRYTRRKIVISDSALQDLRFGGYFRVGDVSSILATFEEDFDIRVVPVNDDLVYLSRRRDSD